MPIILAIEPDRRQAAHVSAIVRHRVGAELILADTTEGALDAIGSQVPDLVLVPALLSPQDDAALNAALRVIAAAAHVRTLTIPVFANNIGREERGGLLSRWRRGRSEPTPDGCDPAVFAEQVSEYLREAAAERAAIVAAGPHAPAAVAEPEPVAELTPVADLDPATDFEAAPVPPAAPVVEPAIETMIEPAIETMIEPAIETVIEPAIEPALEPVFAPAAELAEEPLFVAASLEPAVETPAPFAAEPFAPHTPLVFDFAPAPEALTRPLMDLVTAARHEDLEAIDEDALGDDEVLIDLSEDLAGISPEAAAEELFDGERVGVYTISSFDDDQFTLGDDEPIAARPLYEPLEDAETEPPLDIAEFEEDEAFAAFAAPAPMPAVTTAAGAPAVPVAAAAKQDERAAPAVAEPVAAVAQKRDDGWVSMGLRHVWAWPAIEGVAAESPSLLASLEQFSQVVAAPAPPKPAVSLPRPHVVAPAPKADHMEWAELIASLRQDIERRRNQPAAPAPVVQRHPAPTAVHRDMRPKRKSTPVQDEWGFFDPHQCGFAALLEKLDQITDTDEETEGRRPA
jgi:hypothetical protein